MDAVGQALEPSPGHLDLLGREIAAMATASDQEAKVQWEILYLRAEIAEGPADQHRVVLIWAKVAPLCLGVLRSIILAVATVVLPVGAINKLFIVVISAARASIRGSHVRPLDQEPGIVPVIGEQDLLGYDHAVNKTVAFRPSGETQDQIAWPRTASDLRFAAGKCAGAEERIGRIATIPRHDVAEDAWPMHINPWRQRLLRGRRRKRVSR